MTRRTADALWGTEAVAHALAEPRPAPVTRELAAEVERRADPPGAFRAWALSLPWPQFCAVVRIVAGVERRRLLEQDEVPPMVKDMLSFRVEPEDAQRLEALAKRYPIIARSTLARAALRLGMARLEREGLAALEGPDAGSAPASTGEDGDR